MPIDLSSLNDGQRRIATMLDVPLFVEAGAGSGKTFTLTQRIAWALSPGSGEGGAPFLDGLDQVLVITFTEAAAREIKERVRSTLWSVGMRPAALAVDDAWISTIHGMCARIVRRHALDLGIDPAFAVCQPHLASELREAATNAEVGAAWDAAGSDPSLARLFDEFGYAGVVGRIEALTARAAQAGGFPRLVLPPGGALPGVMTRLLAACEALAAVPAATPKARATMAPALEALRAFEALPPGRRDAAHAREALDCCRLPRSSKAIAERLAEVRPLLAEARALALLEGTRELAPSLLALAERTDARFAALKRARSLLDYDDLVADALSVVDGTSGVAASYARQFRLVMVDEFQDTDSRQLRLISLLSGRSADHLATVGDAQQSIYRFRGADVGVFEARGLALPPDAHVRLDTNYRSHADVLAFVERVCGGPEGVLDGFMHLDDNPLRPDGYRAPMLPRVSIEVASGPCVVGGRASSRQTALLAAQVADRLAAYRDAGHRAGEMALLLGVMTNAGTYVDALRACGLECVVTGGSGFASTPEVAAVQALLHALANPTDTRSGLFPLLSSEVFGLDACDFIQLGTRAQELLDAPTKRSITQGLADMTFFRDGVPSLRLRRAAEVFGRALDRLAFVPVADVCLDVVRESGWLSRLEGEGAIGASREANVLAAIRYIRELTEGLGLGPARAAVEFDRWLAVSKVPPASLAGDAADVVRVMTIHASKGLEFPVVAVAECWGNPRGASGVLFGPGEEDGTTSVVVCPAERAATDDVEVGGTPANLAEWHHALREHDRAGGAAEQARLLYVGLTRAREALVVALNCPTSRRGISYGLAGGVADALFGRSLPPAGVSDVDYGGTKPARVRHVVLSQDGDACVADSAATMPGADGALSDDVTAVARLGARTHDPAHGGAGKSGGTGLAAGRDAAAAAADADGGCPVSDAPFGGHEGPFALYEPGGDAPQPRVGRLPAREGVFSYSSLRARAREAPALPREGAAPEALAPMGRDDLSKATSLGPAHAHGRPTRSEREAAVTGAPMPEDADRATNLGSAFHALAQAMAESGRLPSKGRVEAAVRQWHLSERQRERLSSALRRWEKSRLRREACAHDLMRAEVPFFLAVGDAPYGTHAEGTIDLLCTDGDGTDALVIDYKTGDVGLTPAEVRVRHEPQARFYAAALLRQGFTSVSCAFVCVEVDDGTGEPLTARYAFDAEGGPVPF